MGSLEELQKMPVQKFEHVNDEPGQTGLMSVAFDVQSGEVLSLGTGFWSVRQAGAFFLHWKELIRRIHEAGQSVCALVDLSDSSVQKAEVADLIATTADGLYAHGDAIAMVVPNSLVKMQMRRVLSADVHEFFISRSAAEMWLESRRGRVPTINGQPTLRLAPRDHCPA